MATLIEKWKRVLVLFVVGAVGIILFLYSSGVPVYTPVYKSSTRFMPVLQEDTVLVPRNKSSVQVKPLPTQATVQPVRKMKFLPQSHICRSARNNFKDQHIVYGDSCVQEALNMWYVDSALIAEANLLKKKFFERNGNILESTRIPEMSNGVNILSAVMVWCGLVTFQFKHALSVLSVITFAKINTVRIFYDVFPQSDQYHQWIQFLMIQYPYLDFRFCKQCCGRGTVSTQWVRQRLKETPEEIYVDFDMILAEYLSASTLNDFQYNGLPALPKDSAGSKVTQRKCYKLTEPEKVEPDRNICYSSKNLNDFLPSDIWSCKNHFCNVSRLLMYLDRDTISPIKHDHPVIPNIVHYIMFGKFDLSFTFYMSILSFIHIGRVSKVYIHCNNEPTGEYWSKLKEHLEGSNVLEIIHQVKPATVFNQYIHMVEHMADAVKVYILNKYGGIMVDTDLMLIKPIDSELFTHDFVMSRDVNPGEILKKRVNIGMLMSRPNSAFSQIYIDIMRSHKDQLWLWNSGQLPLKMIEYNPHLVHLSPRIQTICPEFQCVKPAGVEENIVSLKQWQQLTCALHFVYPDPFTNVTKLKSQDDLVGEVGHFILASANVSLW